MSQNKKHRVTLRDVANEVGVSPMAVSRVLHGQGGTVRVSEVRAEQIRNAARILGYRPNAIARSLRSRRTHSLAFVWEGIPEFSPDNAYGAILLSGAIPTAFSHGYDLSLCRHFLQKDGVALPDDGRFDGIILCQVQPRLLHDNILQQQALPVVLLHSPPPDAGSLRYVDWDNRGASRQLLDHLASQGHRKIGFAMETFMGHHPDLQARLNEAKKYAPEIGLEPITEAWLELGDRVMDWLRSNPEITAIMFWNETLALVSMNELKSQGLSIPEQLSIVSYDSTEFAARAIPPLTGARQPLGEMASKAVEMLIDRLDGDGHLWCNHHFPSVVDVGGSTAPPRKGPLFR